MRGIVDAAVHNRSTIYLLTAIIVVAGVVSYRDMPREAAPDITIPYVIVSTPYFGVAPSDIETLVTVPLENKLKNLTDVEEMRSTSAEGVSIVVIEFKADFDVDTALQKVRDRVDLAKADLPEDAEEPIIQEINLADFPVMIVNISGTVGLVRLKEMAEELEDRLEGIPGVLDAEITGGLEREIRVEYLPDRLAAYRLAPDDLVRAIQGANLNLPAGNMVLGEADLLLRVPGEFRDPREILDVVVSGRGGAQVRVRDVAAVVDGFKEPKTYSRLDGNESVTLAIQKRSGENIVRICDEARAVLADYAAASPGGVTLTVALDASKDIRRMVADLNNNVITGFLLVVAVVLLSMGLLNSVFVAAAIPLSALIGFIILHFSGITLNMVVLFSLILVVGMVCDNAIVVTENAFRHLGMGKTRLQAALDGAAEVILPVLTSTLTTVAAFVPFLWWPGIMGEFMWYLPVAVITTLMASFFVAAVINPTLIGHFMNLRGGRTTDVDELTGLTRDPRHFLNRFEGFLRVALARKYLVVGLAMAALVGSIVLYGFLGRGVQFFPDTDPNRAYINIEAPEGYSLEATDALARQVECCLGDYPDLVHYTTDVGAATDTFGGGMSTKANRARVTLEFVDRHLRRQNSRVTVEQIRRRLATMVGADLEIKKEEHGPPSGKPVNIEITGRDFEVLGRLADQLQDLIKDTPGIVDLMDDYEKGRPEFRVDVDRERAALLGLTTAQVAQTIRTAVNGIKAGNFREADDEYDITVRLPRSLRDDAATLRAMHIGTPGGNQVPLSSVARVEAAGGLGSIRRIDGKRVVTVSSEVEGRLPNDILAEIRPKVRAMRLPEGYAVSFTGQDKEQKESEAFLKRAFTAALLLILLVIVPQFNSIGVPLIIMSTVILSLWGVFFGLVVTRTPFGIIMTGIGVISLAGVVVNNAIILLDAAMKNSARGLSPTDAIVLASKTRLRPVFLTAVTTILGLIPMATGVSFDFLTFTLEIGGESVQWWGPMAVAVIFGLAFATVMTLVVVPAIYLILDSWSRRLIGHPIFGEAER
jgi:CzcA family heavy metal efflux pump